MEEEEEEDEEGLRIWERRKKIEVNVRREKSGNNVEKCFFLGFVSFVFVAITE